MSTKSVAEKLLIKEDTTVWSSNRSHLDLLGRLPEGVRLVSKPEKATTALVFAEDAASLSKILKTHKGQLARPDVFWVAYPKGNRADINRDTVWPILAEYGMRRIGQASVDEVWSAMRFRRSRRARRPSPVGGTGSRMRLTHRAVKATRTMAGRVPPRRRVGRMRTLRQTEGERRGHVGSAS